RRGPARRAATRPRSRPVPHRRRVPAPCQRPRRFDAAVFFAADLRAVDFATVFPAAAPRAALFPAADVAAAFFAVVFFAVVFFAVVFFAVVFFAAAVFLAVAVLAADVFAVDVFAAAFFTAVFLAAALRGVFFAAALRAVFFAAPFDADFFAAPPARRARYSSLRRFFSSASASHCSRERFGPSATSSQPSSLSVYSAQHCGQRMKSPRVLLLFFTTIFESQYWHSCGSGSSQLDQSQSG